MGLPQQHGSIINSTDDVDDYSVSDDSDNKNETIIKKSTKKRITSDPVAVAGENPIPTLVDNKRQHMERQLSSSQRNK